jgi:hypothetical protein
MRVLMFKIAAGQVTSRSSPGSDIVDKGGQIASYWKDMIPIQSMKDCIAERQDTVF